MSFFASFNGERIVSASVVMPYYGIWTADVVLASAIAIPAVATLVIANLTLKGTVFRSASFAGSRAARIVGGAGGWRKKTTKQAYYDPNGVRASMVLGDVAAASGETISLSTDFTVGSSYEREEDAPGSQVLRDLLGEVWWMDPSGVTQCQDRTNKTAITTPFTVGAWSGGKARFEIATEDLAAWQPGRTFTSENVPTPQTLNMVSIDVNNDGKLRLECLTA